MYQRMTKAERQNAVLRKAAGYLVIDDKKLIHGLTVKTYEPNTWKWRLFVPKGHRFVVRMAWGWVPDRGFPKGPSHDHPLGMDGEMTLEAKLRETKSKDDWSLDLTWQDEKLDLEKGAYVEGITCSYGTSVVCPSSFMKNYSDQLSCSGFGLDGTEIQNVDQPVVLLRSRFSKKVAQGAWIMPAGPSPGFVIWLEEQK